MSLNESIVEDAALEWFGELGYAVGHGPHLAPGEPAAERQSFGEVVLVGRLREAIRRLNPVIPEEAREEALRKVLRVGTPSLTQTNRAFHRMLRDGVPAEDPESPAAFRACSTRFATRIGNATRKGSVLLCGWKRRWMRAFSPSLRSSASGPCGPCARIS